MNFRKIGKIIFYGLVLLWFILTMTKILTPSQAYFWLGVLTLYLGIQNLILLNLHAKGIIREPKIADAVKRLGLRAGLIQYSLFAIVLELVLGIVLMFFSN